MKNTAGNDFKLEASIARTRAKIYELAICNAWNYYCTFTISPKHYERSDLPNLKTKLLKWINNYNTRHNIKISYLILPELHADKTNFHFHGLLQGLPISHLTKFLETERLPLNLLILIKQGREIYNWTAYAQTFGHCALEKVISARAISAYIQKYIKKNLFETNIALNHHLYYCSKNLKRAEVIYKGQLTKPLDADFTNDYVQIKQLDTFDEAIQYFTHDNE
jgi:hypothetical protein